MIDADVKTITITKSKTGFIVDERGEVGMTTVFHGCTTAEDMLSLLSGWANAIDDKKSTNPMDFSIADEDDGYAGRPMR